MDSIIPPTVHGTTLESIHEKAGRDESHPKRITKFSNHKRSALRESRHTQNPLHFHGPNNQIPPLPKPYTQEGPSTPLPTANTSPVNYPPVKILLQPPSSIGDTCRSQQDQTIDRDGTGPQSRWLPPSQTNPTSCSRHDKGRNACISCII